MISVSNSFYCYEKTSYKKKINKAAYYVMCAGKGAMSTVREWQSVLSGSRFPAVKSLHVVYRRVWGRGPVQLLVQSSGELLLSPDWCDQCRSAPFGGIPTSVSPAPPSCRTPRCKHRVGCAVNTAAPSLPWLFLAAVLGTPETLLFWSAP